MDEREQRQMLPGLGPRLGSAWTSRANGRLIVVDRLVHRRYAWADVHEVGATGRPWRIKVADLERYYVDTGKLVVDLTTDTTEEA